MALSIKGLGLGSKKLTMYIVLGLVLLLGFGAVGYGLYLNTTSDEILAPTSDSAPGAGQACGEGGACGPGLQCCSGGQNIGGAGGGTCESSCGNQIPGGGDEQISECERICGSGDVCNIGCIDSGAPGCGDASSCQVTIDPSTGCVNSEFHCEYDGRSFPVSCGDLNGSYVGGSSDKRCVTVQYDSQCPSGTNARVCWYDANGTEYCNLTNDQLDPRNPNSPLANCAPRSCDINLAASCTADGKVAVNWNVSNVQGFDLVKTPTNDNQAAVIVRLNAEPTSDWVNAEGGDIWWASNFQSYTGDETNGSFTYDVERFNSLAYTNYEISAAVTGYTTATAQLNGEAYCVAETTSACTPPPTITPPPPPEPVCGDGNVDPGEQCDDGNQVDDDSCNNNCELVYKPECGNDTCDAGESCDGEQVCDNGSNFSPGMCSDVCTYCGDGIQNGTEECDDGNRNNNDSCSNTCREIEQPECGNGIVEEGEECDGNSNACGGGSTCNNNTCTCQPVEPGLCGSTCSNDFECPADHVCSGGTCQLTQCVAGSATSEGDNGETTVFATSTVCSANGCEILSCGSSCGANGACPAGLACNGDNICVAPYCVDNTCDNICLPETDLEADSIAIMLVATALTITGAVAYQTNGLQWLGMAAGILKPVSVGMRANKKEREEFEDKF